MSTDRPRRGGRLEFLLNLAGLAVFWERLWPCLWPAMGVLALFVGVALLDLLPMLPFWLHALALAGFAAALGFAVRGALAGFRPVEPALARQRLERDSGLDHRPLAALDDRPSGGTDAVGRALWQAHLLRLASRLAGLRVRLPSPGLARLDPLGLRAAVVMFLFVGLAAGGGQAGERLARALVPTLDPVAAGDLDIDLWVTPPAYTGLAPVFLEGGVAKAMTETDTQTGDTAPQRILVPVGSTVLAQVSGAAEALELVLGTRRLAFESLGGEGAGRGFRAETEVADGDIGGDAVSILSGGRAVATWPLAVIGDSPPEAEFLRAPAKAGRSQLRMEYEARDDFGVAALQGVIRRPDGRAVPGGGPEIRFDLTLGGRGQARRGISAKDFSAHIWAGTTVQVHLQATDARGQTGDSDAVTLQLPERTFNHPVARAIIAQRKRLAAPSDEVLDEIADGLAVIAATPDHYFHDTVVFLALVTARSRLVHDGDDAAMVQVARLLWNTALRIEDGDFAIAAEELARRQEEVLRALRDGADPEEVDRLMRELQTALDAFMAALAEQMQKDGLQDLPTPPDGQSVEAQDLQRMLDEARELARTGATEAAERMIAELKRMLEAMKNGSRAGQQNKEMAGARKLMDGLRDLTRRQQQLMDRTFKESRRQEGQNPGAMTMPQGQQNRSGQQQGQQGRQQGQGQRRQGQGERQGEGQGQGDHAGRSLSSADQEALRKRLGELMLQMDEMLGSIPPALGQAERSMRGATQQLQEGRPGSAVPHQADALEKLRQATNSAAEQLSRRMGGMAGRAIQRRGSRPGDGRDPFGRQPGGAFGSAVDGEGVKVPDQMEMRRARQILDELRRRAGERERPVIERDYIERLLRRF